MKYLSAFAFFVAVLSMVGARAQNSRILTPKDFEAAEAMKLKPLSAADLDAADKAQAARALSSIQERCIQQLEKGNKDFSYKFVKSGSDLQYEIVEIPRERKSGSYVRYYTASGFAEINSETAMCNHSNQKKDVKNKLLDIYKGADEAAVKLQMETDAAIKGITKEKSTYISGLATFRDVCARAFPSIKTYLQEKGQLPQSLKTTGSGDCTDPNSTAPCPIQTK